MAPNAAKAKKFFKLIAKPTHKSRAIDQMEAWQSTPAHRWIPSTSFQITKHGYLSQRQANWLAEQLKRLQIEVEFTEVKATQ